MIYAPVYLIALHDRGRIIPETYEAAGFACMISESRPTAVVLSCRDEIDPLTRELAEKTGLDVIGLCADHLRLYSAEAYVMCLSMLFREKGPACVCIPHTSQGSDFAPQLSVNLGASCITAVEGISSGSFVRSLFNGRFRAFHQPATPSAVLTLLPGAWKPLSGMPPAPGEITVMDLPPGQISTRTMGSRQAIHANLSLAEAEVIVSAGRGMGKQENVEVLKRLSSLFPRSAIGATRAVCDLGWLDYTHQIGTTGNKVSPRLYIACGVSGALQHTAGMKDSGIIVAINIDAHAAIFRFAHYCIVEDVNTFIPLLIESFEDAASYG